MDIYSVRLGAGDTPFLDANGKMAKGANRGADVAAALRNSNGIYAAHEGSGARGSADAASCRTCHRFLADKDFVFHYAAHFTQRAEIPAERG